MSSQSPYQPPSAVVGPAFNELLHRMRRARVRLTKDGRVTSEPGTPGGGSAQGASGLPRGGALEDALLNADERQVWAYGVEERQRVIERTLTLVFAQWAVHRVAVRHAPMRALRVLYVGCCVVGTLNFIQARAKRVTKEMFAKIVALPTTSPMANEARVILAEMEGPDGAYFRAVCREKQFAEDLHALVAALDHESGADLSDQNLHPQLRLRPRLLDDDAMRAPHPAVRRKARGMRDAVDDPSGNGERVMVRAGARERRDGQTPPVPSVPSVPPVVQSRDAEFAPARRREQKDEPYLESWREHPKRQGRQGAMERGEMEMRGEEQDSFEDEMAPKPFDFAKAAGGRAFGAAGDEMRDAFYGDGDNREELTPSQRRAQERRERRRRARERDIGVGEFDVDRKW